MDPTAAATAASHAASWSDPMVITALLAGFAGVLTGLGALVTAIRGKATADTVKLEADANASAKGIADVTAPAVLADSLPAESNVERVAQAIESLIDPALRPYVRNIRQIAAKAVKLAHIDTTAPPQVVKVSAPPGSEVTAEVQVPAAPQPPAQQ